MKQQAKPKPKEKNHDHHANRISHSSDNKGDDMKEGWMKKKLGDLLQKTEMVDPTKRPNTEFKYIDISSVNNETFQIETISLLKGKVAPSRARKLVRTNDVIFATVRPTLKRIAIIPKDLDEQVCSTGYFVLRTNGEVNSKLIFYYLQTDDFISKMEKLQRGASYPAVTDGDIKEQLFSYPHSSEEQKRIVEILDEAFAAIDKAKANVEKNLQNAKELFEVFLKRNYDKKAKLGELVNITTGRLNANAAVENGVYPFFTCSREVYTIDNYAFDCEAILLAGNNAVGDFNVKHYKGKFNAYQRTYVITAKDQTKLDYRFLYYQMERSLAGLKEQSVGAGTKFLKLPVIQSFEIAYPSIEEQKKIVKELDSLSMDTNTVIKNYRKKLSDLEELKKSVLQKAFAGELTAAAKTLIA